MRGMLLILFLLGMGACQVHSVLHEDSESINAVATEREGTNTPGTFRCNTPVDYAPDPNYTQLYPTKYIKVLFHVMNAESGTYNIDGEEAIDYLTEMLLDANRKLGSNQKLTLPEGNDYPVLDPGYRYRLYDDPDDPADNGFQFHYDEELYYFINKGTNKNNYKKEVIRKYAIKTDSVINIFVMPHHPDSVASPSYPGFNAGIALGTSLKIAGIYVSKSKPNVFSPLLNHEIGHILGLQHAWIKYDGCEDTPQHANCYGPSKEPPCNGIISNNMMDYNFSQIALSPCQIGKIHKNFARLNSRQRKLIEPTWCTYNEEASVTIQDDMVWLAAKDVGGDIIIDSDAALEIRCRLSIPKGGKIIINPGGTLILNGAQLHNACGEQWSGIEIRTKGKRTGQVINMNHPRIENLPTEVKQNN